MHKVYIILVLLKLLSCVSCGSNKLEDHDCFESRDDSSILTCRTIPDCSKTRTILTYKHYKTIVFDLENRNTLSSRSFYNCSFDFSLNIHFKNVKLLSSYSFDSIKVAPGHILNIKLDGSGLNLDKKSSQSKLFVNKLALNNVVLESNSKLNIFIKNYERLFIRDTLVENMLWQSMFSEININVNNVDLVWFKSKSDRIVDVQLDLDDAERRKELESSDPKPVNLDPNAHYISNNLSYSLLINNVNDLVFDPSVYANVQVNTYSDFNVVIKMVKNVFMNSSLFDSLMLGFYSRFSLIVEDANKIGLSNGTFSALQLDQFAVFFTRIDRIGPKYSTKKSLTRREAKQETNNDYFLNDESVINVFDDDQSYQYDSVSGSVSYDYQYEETSDEPPSTYNQWLCVPESTFKNVRLAENALVQIHFIQVNFSLSITKNAFTEIQIDENAKFEMMFQDVKGHIVFDRGAVSMVTLTSGLFEIWIDNHRQKTAATTTNRVNNPSPKFNPKYKSSSLQQKPFRVFNAANKIYFKMFDFAINKIALNSGSNFRIGFINSDSVFSLSSKSIRNYHLGRFDSRKNNDDYRPKLELDLSGSENVNLDFLSVNQVNQSPSDDDDSDDSSSSMPKLIEIDGYLPLMSIVNADRSIELASSNQDSVAVSSDTIKENNSFIKKRLKLKSKSYLLDEFCQLFKLRPFMTSIKSDKHFGLRNNLIYFTDTSIKEFSKSKTGEAPEMCTSCLFIYLYRTIQRRADFFYVKDHLPKCFINLHFKDEKSLELLNSSTEKYKKEKYIKTIEESFKIYWKLLNCSSLTGLKSILDYNAEQNESDETLGDYEAIEKRCESMRAANEDETNSLDANSWHESALRICGKNTIDLNLNRANGLKKQTKKFSQISKRLPQNQLSFKITFLVVALFSFFTVIFIYFKYYKIDKPCIKINWRKRNSFQRLQNPSEIRYYTTRANQNQQNGDDEAEHPEQSYDEMQAYEYDDEFEINEGVSGVEASKLELDENIATSHLYTTSSNTENLEFRMDGNEFDSAPSSSGLFAKTRHPFKQMRRIKESFLSSSPKDLLISSLKKFPSYSYNSTDSTLVQNRANNELELAAAAKSASVVIYDSSKNRITPNLVKSAAEKIDEEEPRMRLALNPLEDLETVDNKSSTVNKIA